MKKYRVSRMIDGYLHSSCIKCKDKETAIRMIQASQTAGTHGKTEKMYLIGGSKSLNTDVKGK